MAVVTTEEWCAAMMGGKYKQGRNVLKDGNKFCPLGVLLDLLGVTWEGGDFILEGRKYSGAAGLPLPLFLMDSRRQNIVVRANDIVKQSFKEIVPTIKELFGDHSFLL